MDLFGIVQLCLISRGLPGGGDVCYYQHFGKKPSMAKPKLVIAKGRIPHEPAGIVRCGGFGLCKVFASFPTVRSLLDEVSNTWI